MRIVLLAVVVSMLGLQALQTKPPAAASAASTDLDRHEHARDRLLTAEERVDVASRRLALEARSDAGETL